jgi:glycosyltransferase 2 family protein
MSYRSIRDDLLQFLRRSDVQKRLIVAVQVVLFCFIIAFLFLRFKDYLHDPTLVLKIENPIFLGFAFLFVLVTLLLHSLTWKLILSRLGILLSYTNSLYIYFYSNLARYIPGTYWFLLSRSALAVNRGVDPTLTLAGSGVEIAISVLSSAFLALLGIITGQFWDISKLIWLSVWALIGVASMFAIRKYGSQQESSVAGKLSQVVQILRNTPPALLVSWVGIYLISAISQGFALLCIFNLWKPIGINSLIPIVIGYYTSWLIGFINPLTPNGIGSREVVMVTMLGGLVPAPVILAASLALRLVVMIGETIITLVSWSLQRWVFRTKDPAEKRG